MQQASSGQQAVNPIWVHSVTVEPIGMPGSDKDAPPKAIQLTITGETPQGGEFTQIIGLSAELLGEICHQIRTNT